MALATAILLLASTFSAALSGNWAGAWSPTGGDVAVLHYRSRTSEQNRIDVIDVKTRARRVLFDPGPGWWLSALSWSPDGKQLALSAYPEP